MNGPLTRRTLLGAGGSAAALSVAGCSELSTDDEPAGQSDAVDGGHEVAVVAEIDQAQLEAAEQDVQETQQEAQAELQAGEIDEEEAEEIVQEAQAEFEATRAELLEAAVSAIESHADDVSGLTIAGTEPEFGALLVEGEGDSIVEMLALDDVQAIVDSAEYDAI